MDCFSIPNLTETWSLQTYILGIKYQRVCLKVCLVIAKSILEGRMSHFISIQTLFGRYGIWKWKVHFFSFSIRILKERGIKSERSRINCDIFSSFVKCIGLHPMLVDRSSVWKHCISFWIHYACHFTFYPIILHLIRGYFCDA